MSFLRTFFSLSRMIRKHIDTFKINILYHKVAAAYHLPRTSSQIKHLALRKSLAWITKLFQRTSDQTLACYIEPANESKPLKFGQKLLHEGFNILSFSAWIWYGNLPSIHCSWECGFLIVEDMKRKTTKSSVPNEREDTTCTERRRLL